MFLSIIEIEAKKEIKALRAHIENRVKELEIATEQMLVDQAIELCEEIASLNNTLMDTRVKLFNQMWDDQQNY